MKFPVREPLTRQDDASSTDTREETSIGEIIRVLGRLPGTYVYVINSTLANPRRSPSLHLRSASTRVRALMGACRTKLTSGDE